MRRDSQQAPLGQGISGAKGRDKLPGLDTMLKGARSASEFDLLAAWSTDQLGRSLPDLLKTLEELRTSGRGLYLHNLLGRSLMDAAGLSELDLVARLWAQVLCRVDELAPE